MPRPRQRPPENDAMSNSAATINGFGNRGPAVFAVSTATLCLASVFVAARLVSRIAIVRRVGWDDYLIILAWLFAFALCLTIDLGTKYGLGSHYSSIHEENKTPLKRCEYVFSVLYVSPAATVVLHGLPATNSCGLEPCINGY
jgi:hypothetical protein